MPERFLARVHKAGDCWLWLGSRFNTGYGEFYLYGRRTTAHRSSYILFNGPIPDGMLVCHKCDIKQCVRPDHLFLGDHRDNLVDAINKGRHFSPRGEKAGRAKLTRKDVLAIRQRFDAGESRETLAELYGVTTQHISVIGRRLTWAWLPDCRMPAA